MRERLLERLASGEAKVAIVHEWLVTHAGSEQVLDELAALFPRARLFTLIDKRPRGPGNAGGRHAVEGVDPARVTTSWMRHIPGIARSYRSWLPLMPLAVRSLDVSKFDLVISNSHAVAKGVRTHADQLHLCYCISPMRYAWDLKEQYLRESGLDHGVKGAVVRVVLERLRRWDLANSERVDAFATLSHYIGERIQRAYGRSAEVIYPPVDTEFFTPGDGVKEDYYVTVSRFVPYKCVDMIASAFRELPDRKLVIIGDGPDAEKVRRAAGPNVELLGRLNREEVRWHLRRARAFLFAAEEDFGIAPVEAQACGTPVIAFGRGGALETVLGAGSAAPTGALYQEQTGAALANAIRRFELAEPTVTAEACRANALRFAGAAFRQGFRAFVAKECERGSTHRACHRPRA